MSAHLQIQRPARAPTHRRASAGIPLATHPLVTLTVAFLAAVLLLLARTANGAEVALTVNVAPPPLPVYEQPPLPAAGYIWVPGYWSYGPEGYFWVPGTWVLPPDPDLVWTPGYWEFSDGAYLWRSGYWGPEVGFYGGIVYGFGYFGHGYDGGYWRDHQFYYNRAVNNISNTDVPNVYSKTVVNNTTINHISYNGGPGGVGARPTAQEQAAGHQPRHAATSEQTAQVAGARNQHELLASVNQGHPPIAATPKPNMFSEPPRRLAQAPPPPPPPERPAPAAPPDHPSHAAAAERTAPAGRPPQERAPQERPPADKPPPRHDEPNHKPNQPEEPPRP
jgi:WXXGXW repeat (2 copies)